MDELTYTEVAAGAEITTRTLKSLIQQGHIPDKPDWTDSIVDDVKQFLDSLIGQADAAELIGVKETTFQSWRNYKRLRSPHTHIRRQPYWLRTDIEELAQRYEKVITLRRKTVQRPSFAHTPLHGRCAYSKCPHPQSTVFDPYGLHMCVEHMERAHHILGTSTRKARETYATN